MQKEDLYDNTDVVKLNDKDFNFEPSVKLTNKSFKNKDGYIMFYANWCPNCQNKKDFWSLLGKEFNKNKQYANENFRIGAIDSESPAAQKITEQMDITYIPRFIHVDKEGNLKDYEGPDYEPISLISEVCQKKNKLCAMKNKF